MTQNIKISKNWQEALTQIGHSSGKINALVTRTRRTGLHHKDKKKGKENLFMIGEEMERLKDAWLEFISLYQAHIESTHKELKALPLPDPAKANVKPNQKPIKSKPKAKR